MRFAEFCRQPRLQEPTPLNSIECRLQNHSISAARPQIGSNFPDRWFSPGTGKICFWVCFQQTVTCMTSFTLLFASAETSFSVSPSRQAPDGRKKRSRLLLRNQYTTAPPPEGAERKNTSATAVRQASIRFQDGNPLNRSGNMKKANRPLPAAAGNFHEPAQVRPGSLSGKVRD